MRMVLIAVVLTPVLALAGAVVAQPPAQQAEAPASLIAPTVVDIPKGAKAAVHPEAVVIDEDKKVWLVKQHPVAGGDPTGVTVLHQQDGTLEVEVSDPTLRWVRSPLNAEAKKSLLPVQKLTLTKSKDAGQPRPVEPKKS